MNWLPTPPTDNLYKFLAIFGTWGMLFVFGSLLLLFYQNHEHSEFTKKVIALSSEESWLRKVEARAESLAKNRLTENIIPGISDHFSPKEEMVFIKNAVNLSRGSLPKLRQLAGDPPTNVFPFLATIHFDRWLVGVLVFSWVCFYYGFRQWLVLQRITDELLRLDLSIKRAQEREIKRKRFRNAAG